MMNAVGICAFSQSNGSDPGEDKLRFRRGGTMRKFVAAAAGSALALAGFAGAANASATIDLIWVATGTNTLPVFPSSAATLRVILTAGPAGAITAGVSVDYSEVLGALVVTGFASTPRGKAPYYLPTSVGSTIDTGSRIENINSSTAPQFGIGLPAGASRRLGTVTFQDSTLIDGTFEIRSDTNAPTDGVVDLSGGDISDTTTFNSAFVTLPEPSALTALGSGISMLAILYRRRSGCRPPLR
jgi:hypothetical protein